MTFWFESIYRMSLIKLSMGPEMLGLLVVFAPLLVVLVPRSKERTLAKAAILVLIMARLALPFFGARGSILVAGIGSAAGFVLLCTFFARPDALTRRGIGAGVGLGVLMSIALRAWGSSYDVTTDGLGVLILWVLAVLTLFILRGIRDEALPAPTKEPTGFFANTIGMLAFFGNFALVYLMFSSPAVISAWSGSSYTLNVVIVTVAWSLAIIWPADRLSRKFLIVSNAGFGALLVIGILLQRVVFPATPNDPPVTVYPSPFVHHVPLYLALLLSPVILANVHAIAKRTCARRAGSMGVPVTIGAFAFLVIALLLTFSNTWGYVDEIGPFMRNKFYLPFVIACTLMLLPHILIYGGRDRMPKPFGSSVNGGIAIALAVIAMAGVSIRSLGSSVDSDPERLTVLTYNMQVGSEEDGDRNYRRQLALLRAIDADLIGLQESDTPRPAGGNVDAARYFADALGYYMYFGPSTVTGTYGTAILSRYPISNPHTIFTYSTKDEVGTAIVEVEIDGKTIAFMNSHPAGKWDVHQAHMDALIEAALQYDCVIALGDYNTRPGSPYYEQAAGVLNNAWTSLYPNGTGPRHPEIAVGDGASKTIDMPEPIDHIFLSRNLKTLEAYYIPSPESETDHPAHWAIVSWK